VPFSSFFWGARRVRVGENSVVPTGLATRATCSPDAKAPGYWRTPFRGLNHYSAFRSFPSADALGYAWTPLRGWIFRVVADSRRAGVCLTGQEGEDFYFLLDIESFAVLNCSASFSLRFFPPSGRTDFSESLKFWDLPAPILGQGTSPGI